MNGDGGRADEAVDGDVQPPSPGEPVDLVGYAEYVLHDWVERIWTSANPLSRLALLVPRFHVPTRCNISLATEMRNLDQQDSKPSPCIGAQLHFPNLRESAQICVPPPHPFLNPHDGRSSDEDEFPRFPGCASCLHGFIQR